MPLDRVMSRSFHVTQQCGFLMKERISEHHGKGVGTKFFKKTADDRMYIVHIYIGEGSPVGVPLLRLINLGRGASKRRPMDEGSGPLEGREEQQILATFRPSIIYRPNRPC
jgi:hypothetical protein